MVDPLFNDLFNTGQLTLSLDGNAIAGNSTAGEVCSTMRGTRARQTGTFAQLHADSARWRC